MRLGQDATNRRRPNFAKPRRAEQHYARQLRKLARHIGEIVRGFDLDQPDAMAEMEDTLKRYSDIITPWAESVAARMIEDVSKRDAKEWLAHSREIGRLLQQEIDTAPTGQAMRERLAEQVSLIKSLPIEAAERVHKLTLEGISNSTRASEIAKEIAASGEVAASRANLIARTEVARTSSLLTQVRAEYIGSEGYIWRTAHDSDVRKSHKQMEGKFVKWNDPPTLSDGTTTHAGQIYNCRCYPEPVIPDVI